MTYRRIVWSMGLALALIFALGTCSSSDPVAPQITAVMGSVSSTGGQALSGVTVSGGGVATTSGSDGRFQLDIAAGPGALLTFGKEGYINTQRRVDVQDGTATAVRAVIKAQAPAIPFDATTGDTALGQRNAGLTAGPGAFVDGEGGVVSGTVNVHLTPFDPSEEAELDAIPTFRAAIDSGGQGELESFGVLDVTVRDEDGNTLQIAPETEVTIRIPAPAGVTVPPAPDTMPLWSYDETAGIWREEGTLVYIAGQHVYEGTITHMSLWNADIVMETTCIKGRVTVESGQPLPGAYITAHGADYAGTSSASANANGEFCVPVRKNSRVKVTAIHPEGGGQTRTISSGNADTGVPPNCGDSRCLDVGEWVVKPGVLDDDGVITDCSALPNPFAGTCVEDLWAFTDCFQPEGACTMNLGDGSNVTISWANDAWMGVETSATLTQTMRLYGSAGTGNLCVTLTLTPSLDGDTTIAYQLPGSTDVYLMTITEDGDQIFQCPNGETITITTAQMQAMEACGGYDTEATAETCSIEGGWGDLGTCGPSQPCLSGEVCCDLGSGVATCVPEDSVDFLGCL